MSQQHIFGSWPTHREKRRRQRKARLARRPVRSPRYVESAARRKAGK